MEKKQNKRPVEHQEIVTLQLDKKIVVLRLTDFDTDIDVNDLTQIHYHNMIGELLTCSAALNRIGNLLAEWDNIIAEAKLDMEIYEAQMDEELRKVLVVETQDDKGKAKYKAATNEAVTNAIKRKPDWAVKSRHILKLQKQWGYINSLYWAMKSKDDKLNKLTDKLRPEEFEKDIVEEKVNGIYIKLADKTIK